MLKIKLICIGDFGEKFWRDAKEEYEKRLSRFFDFSTQILKEEGKEKESLKILEKIEGYAILLDINGTERTSEEFAQRLTKLSQTNSKLTFIIGGSEGVLDVVKQNVSETLSFGKITLPHQLARIVFLEQLYRAGTILNGIKYHK